MYLKLWLLKNEGFKFNLIMTCWSFPSLHFHFYFYFLFFIFLSSKVLQHFSSLKELSLLFPFSRFLWFTSTHSTRNKMNREGKFVLSLFLGQIYPPFSRTTIQIHSTHLLPLPPLFLRVHTSPHSSSKPLNFCYYLSILSMSNWYEEAPCPSRRRSGILSSSN
jgi:hypothetical protein